MMYSLGLPLVALVGISMANPVPQGLDLDLIAALPSPSSYTIAIGLASQSVSVNAVSAASAVLSAISADPSASTILLSATATVEKRQASSCTGQVQPTGAGPVPTPDTPSAFVSYSAFAAAASTAPVPAGWTQVYEDLDASNNGYYYMGYTTLTSYDSNKCAAACAAIFGCTAINLYFERDPSVDPTSGCPNPPSTTNIKCVFWGAPLDAGTATNTGQYRDDFEVVIAGSNAYNLNPATPPGYTTLQYLGAAAINAPDDCNGYNTYMGEHMFQNVPFNVSLCAAACTAKSMSNLASGNPQTCQFFNTYMLYENGAPIAQTCAMYNETWNATYAVNYGQYDGAGNHYTIADSYISSNMTNPGVCTPLPTAPTYFYLAVTSSDGMLTDQELALTYPTGYFSLVASAMAVTDGTPPTVFTLDAAGYLLANSMNPVYAGDQDYTETPAGALFFDSFATIQNNDFKPVTCAISGSDQLSCQGYYGGSVFSYCTDSTYEEGTGLSIGSDVPEDCMAVTVTVIAAPADSY